MFKFTFFLLSLMIFDLRFAFAENTCYQQETNFRTRARFASDEEYQTELSWWQNKAPETPSLYDLALAFKVYNDEKSTALKLKSDKKAHCYIGCRISQETSFEVADYSGWLKEERDLKDCKTSTHYDEADYTATLNGAHIGENNQANCFNACKEKYKPLRK